MRLQNLLTLRRPGLLGLWPVSHVATWISNLSVITPQSQTPPSNPQGTRRWLLSALTPLHPGTYAERSGTMMGLCCHWTRYQLEVKVGTTPLYAPWGDTVPVGQSARLSDAWMMRNWYWGSQKAWSSPLPRLPSGQVLCALSKSWCPLVTASPTMILCLSLQFHPDPEETPWKPCETWLG